MSDAADNKGTMTSESYTKMVEEIEAEIKRVKAENNPDNKTKLTELKKEKRALKNKASAMRCREKKRRRMEDLEKTVAELNKKLLRLEQENKQLRAAAAGNTATEPQTTAPMASMAATTTKSVPLQRIRYTAPQKRRASDIITSSPHVSQQTSGSILKSSKLSHSRAHAVFAPILCQVFSAAEGSVPEYPHGSLPRY